MRALFLSLVPLLVAISACSTPRGEAPDTGVAASGFRCLDCLSSADCGDDQCIQYALDVACAPSCEGGCAAGSSCQAYTTVSGDQVMVCVPDVPQCGAEPDVDAGPTEVDAGTGIDAAMPQTCGNLTGPSASACCSSCSTGGTCATNGCYGGWWCNTASCRCQPAPTSCGESDAGVAPVDAGPPPTGNVGPSGGTVSSLFFAVLGDSRPAVETDTTSGYPTTIVQQLYTDLEALSPHPEFALVTGDYCFAGPHGPGAHAQMGLYLGARAAYSGTVFFAMGNHECTGQTSSNCGASGADGLTNNYRSFLSDMLAPIGQTAPYYQLRIDATDGRWTSKVIFAAPNAWDATQDAWLRNALTTPTTYTFVVYHEPADTSSGPPGLAPINAILAASSVTLRITGHSHTYYHRRGTNEVTIGLGGAPPAGSYDYGYLTVQQLGSGDIEVRELDYMGGTLNDTFRVHPDGSSAP